MCVYVWLKAVPVQSCSLRRYKLLWCPNTAEACSVPCVPAQCFFKPNHCQATPAPRHTFSCAGSVRCVISGLPSEKICTKDSGSPRTTKSTSKGQAVLAQTAPCIHPCRPIALHEAAASGTVRYRTVRCMSSAQVENPSDSQIAVEVKITTTLCSGHQSHVHRMLGNCDG